MNVYLWFGKALGFQGQPASPEYNRQQMTNSVLVLGREKRNMTLSISFGSFKEILPSGSLDLETLGFLGNWERREERNPLVLCQRY